MDITALIQTMEQERKIHEKILAAKKEERKLIYTLNADALMENTQRITQYVHTAKILEEKRRTLTRKIARQLDIPTEEPTIQEILYYLPPVNRIELEKSGENLKSVVYQVKEENQVNAIALQQTSASLNKEIEFTAKTANSGVYQRGGNKSKNGGIPRAGINLRA